MKAPEFDLLGVDGKRYSPITARGDKGLLVMFICNHCPYVKRVIDGVVRDCKALAPLGIGSIAVMSNDPTDCRPSRAPTARCARRNSSGSTPGSTSSTTAASTRCSRR